MPHCMIAASGLGFDNPIDPGPMEEADCLNGRVESQLSLMGE